jgi:hypothetical protein
MKYLTLCLAVMGGAIGSGCTTVASQKYVAFPTHPIPPDQQMLDQAQCEQIAQGHKGSEAEAAVAGGLIGTAIGGAGGAAYGAILGGLTHGLSAGSGSLAGLAVGAGVGLTVGIVQALQTQQRRYERIYIACLSSRGYTLGG